MKQASSRLTHVRIFTRRSNVLVSADRRMPFAGRSIEEIRAKQAEQLPLQQLKSAHVPARMRHAIEVDVSARPGKATANRARATDKDSPVLPPF